METSSHLSSAMVLKNFGIIAHQTDTVFGLACLPIESLLSRLSRIKKRDNKKSFILLASSTNQIAHFIRVDNHVLEQLNTPMTNPTTWLVEASNTAPAHLIGSTNKIAVRITQHTNIKHLCSHVGAIVSTSANISQQQTCSNAQQARAVFGPSIDYIDQNQAPSTGKSSTINDLSTGNVLQLNLPQSFHQCYPLRKQYLLALR